MNEHGGHASDFEALCATAHMDVCEAAEYLGLDAAEVKRLAEGAKMSARVAQIMTVEAKFGSSKNASRDPEISLSSHSFPRAGRQPVAISLFSGGGGLDIGIEKAGFKTVACVELDANCCETLRSNKPRFFKHAEIINASVDDVDLDALMVRCHLQEGELDLLFGGPPCQTFSQIGKLSSLNDARGKLLFSMVNYARRLRPKAIIIENVKALLSAKTLSGVKGGVIQRLKSELEGLGYVVGQKIINSADFGVAQTRHRLFLVAVKGNEPFLFPEGVVDPGKYETVEKALEKLPTPAPKGKVPLINNHVDVTPAGDRHRISYVPEGSFLAKVEDAPEEVRGRLSSKDTTKFLRLGRKKQSNTLRCGEIFFHPLEDRYLTPREYMRLHGFPDEYVLHGPIRGRSGSVKNLDQHRQVANSVPPPVGLAVGRAVALHLQRLADTRDG
jgi:DNA (cytosine-5)-methyltransferase 1